MLKRFLSIIISFSVALALSQGLFPDCAYAALVWTERQPAGDANKKTGDQSPLTLTAQT